MNLNSISQTQIDISQKETLIKKGNTEIYEKTTSASNFRRHHVKKYPRFVARIGLFFVVISLRKTVVICNPVWTGKGQLLARKVKNGVDFMVSGFSFGKWAKVVQCKVHRFYQFLICIFSNLHAVLPA